MAFGCQIWDQYGSLILDTTDYTARLVYSEVKAGNSSGSTYIAEADGAMPMALATPGPNSTTSLCLNVGITTTGTLNWSPVKDYDGTVLSGETQIMVYVCDQKA